MFAIRNEVAIAISFRRVGPALFFAAKKLNFDRGTLITIFHLAPRLALARSQCSRFRFEIKSQTPAVSLQGVRLEGVVHRFNSKAIADGARMASWPHRTHARRNQRALFER